MDNSIKNGTLPNANNFKDEKKLDIYTYTLKSKNSQFKIDLEFIDAPGEFFQNPDNDDKLIVSDGKKTYNSIIDYLMSCHGIIFLLDYGRSKPTENNKIKSYYSLLWNLFSEFKIRSSKLNQATGQYIQQYMAFCVTKADEDELWGKKDSMSLVKETMGEKMWSYLINNYSLVNTDLDASEREQPRKDNRCNFYMTTAFGRYKDPEGKYVQVLKKPSESSPDTNTPEQNTSEKPNINTPEQNTSERWIKKKIINNDNPSNNKPTPRKIADDETVQETSEETSKEIDNKSYVEQGQPCNPRNILGFFWLCGRRCIIRYTI
jgi:hypothetical protein